MDYLCIEEHDRKEIEKLNRIIIAQTPSENQIHKKKPFHLRWVYAAKEVAIEEWQETVLAVLDRVLELQIIQQYLRISDSQILYGWKSPELFYSKDLCPNWSIKSSKHTIKQQQQKETTKQQFH